SAARKSRQPGLGRRRREDALLYGRHRALPASSLYSRYSGLGSFRKSALICHSGVSWAVHRGDSMMKQILVGALALIFCFAPLAFSQTKSATTPPGGEDWKALDHKWLDSERTG